MEPATGATRAGRARARTDSVLRRVLTMVADCERCDYISEPFTFMSLGGSHENSLEGGAFFEHLPFGWATWTTGGWGSYDQDRTCLICPECVEKAKVSGEGRLRLSPKTILDGLSEV